MSRIPKSIVHTKIMVHVPLNHGGLLQVPFLDVHLDFFVCWTSWGGHPKTLIVKSLVLAFGTFWAWDPLGLWIWTWA